MHQNSYFWAQKSKTFLGRGTAPSPDPSPVGRGHPLPTPHPLGAFGASLLAPTALDSSRAFSARPRRLRRLGTRRLHSPRQPHLLDPPLGDGREGERVGCGWSSNVKMRRGHSTYWQTLQVSAFHQILHITAWPFVVWRRQCTVWLWPLKEYTLFNSLMIIVTQLAGASLGLTKSSAIAEKPRDALSEL